MYGQKNTSFHWREYTNQILIGKPTNRHAREETLYLRYSSVAKYCRAAAAPTATLNFLASIHAQYFLRGVLSRVVCAARVVHVQEQTHKFLTHIRRIQMNTAHQINVRHFVFNCKNGKENANNIFREISGCQKLGSIFIEMGKDRIESSGENKRISRTAWERWTGIRMRQGKSLCVWVLARTKLIRRKKKKTNKHTLLRRFHFFFSLRNCFRSCDVIENAMRPPLPLRRYFFSSQFSSNEFINSCATSQDL